MTRWGARQIVGEDAGRQPELGRVRAFDDLALVVELQHRHHGAEDLLAHDGHVVPAIVEIAGATK